jgi:hypothetical protein
MHDECSRVCSRRGHDDALFHSVDRWQATLAQRAVGEAQGAGNSGTEGSGEAQRAGNSGTEDGGVAQAAGNSDSHHREGRAGEQSQGSHQ